MLNVGAALQIPADKLPIQDPLEPNDNLVWVDGTAFGKPSTPIWQGGKQVEVNALLDKTEDPVDVYRIIIPARKSAKISVIPRFGDPSLEVFTTEAISVNDVDGRVARSRLAGSKKTERVTVRNRGSKKRSYFIADQTSGQFALPRTPVFVARSLSSCLQSTDAPSCSPGPRRARALVRGARVRRPNGGRGRRERRARVRGGQ